MAAKKLLKINNKICGKLNNKFVANVNGIAVQCWPSPRPVDYLTFTAEANTNIAFSVIGTLTHNQALEYRVDDGAWSNYTFGTNISLTTGQKCQFKGDNDWFSESSLNYIRFTSTGAVAASGNIMSLVDSTCESLTISYAYCFYFMFSNCSTLVAAPSLPATTLASYCYQSMFSGCYSLTAAPELPATTLAVACYSHMFEDCTGLTIAPELPATTLASYCYEYMFYGTYILNFNFLHVNTIYAAALDKIHERATIRLGTNLKWLESPFTSDSSARSLAYKIYYEFEETDTPEFNINNAISKGTSKGTITYNIYTNNSLIKNGVLSQANQYTIVNVYHLDGTPWEE